MYNKTNYEDAFLEWVEMWGGCEYEERERAWEFYDLIKNKLANDDESACGYAKIDYEADDYAEDLAVARAIAREEAWKSDYFNEYYEE